MFSPGSLTKHLSLAGLKVVHVALALGSVALAGFWLFSWMQGSPDAYGNQHLRGLTLALTLMLISLATLAGRGPMRNAALAVAMGLLVVGFLLR